MRISVSEWSALRLAVKLPRALLDPERLVGNVRRYAGTRRGIAVAGCVLLALFVVLHVKTASPEVKRLTDLVAQLATVKSIDARWDAAIVRARSQASGTPQGAVQETDLPRIQRALQDADTDAKTTALRTTLTDLRKAYVEKADVLARFEDASADARTAISAVMRSDAAVTGLVREAWRDFPQRERLVAAENLAVRVIVETQQYHQSPTAAHRSSLEGYLADLPRSQSLPKNVQAGLTRLGNDVHQLLLLKPLEHMLGERLGALDTAGRIDQVTQLYQRELADKLAARERWQIALALYTAALIAFVICLGIRAIARFRDLELLYAAQTRELAKTLHRLQDYERGRGAAEAPAEEDARVVSEHRRLGS